ncbi:hypothetical protein HDU86_000427 [Geranomyces michiganensis]|nr:hypothetical protein HDU86_000427 [Geranomyces michiganensis]
MSSTTTPAPPQPPPPEIQQQQPTIKPTTPTLTTPTMDYKIRLATSTDATALSALAEETFRATFNPVPGTPTETNTQHDVDAYCESAFSPAIQAREIADGVVFVATTTRTTTNAESLIGYARLTHTATEPCLTLPTPRGELNRLYVAPAYANGKGIGSALFNAVVSHARTECGDRSLWLGVWEHNYAAKRFYARKGLKRCGEHVFLFGSDPQVDEIWEMELV